MEWTRILALALKEYGLFFALALAGLLSADAMKKYTVHKPKALEKGPEQLPLKMIFAKLKLVIRSGRPHIIRGPDDRDGGSGPSSGSGGRGDPKD